MMRWVVFVVFFVMVVDAAEAQTIITIDVQENGDTLWNIEKSTQLPTQEAIDNWIEFIQKGQDPEQNKKDISDFQNRIEGFLHSAQKYSNRSMQVVNFNISYETTRTLSGDFSIIRYSFEWKNFSRVDSEKIFLGDIFSEGMMISTDNILIIKIPGGYEVETASPSFDKQDGNRLIWDGTLYRSFGKGEPAIVLSRKGIDYRTLFIVFMVALISVSSVIFWKKRHAKLYDNINDVVLSPYRQDEFVGYEDMIEQYLIKCGGQAHQSDIVKYSGLSASKISVVINQMKENGRILKIRKGKENILRQAKK
jgi:hypothetical protein